MKRKLFYLGATQRNTDKVKLRMSDWICVFYRFTKHHEESFVAMKEKEDYKRFQLSKCSIYFRTSNIKSQSDTFSNFLRALK